MLLFAISKSCPRKANVDAQYFLRISQEIFNPSSYRTPLASKFSPIRTKISSSTVFILL
jgi:hypothetical protein